MELITLPCTRLTDRASCRRWMGREEGRRIKTDEDKVREGKTGRAERAGRSGYAGAAGAGAGGGGRGGGDRGTKEAPDTRLHLLCLLQL